MRARLTRQAILYQPGHHIVIALGEAALRDIHSDPDVQRQQLGHLHIIADGARHVIEHSVVAHYTATLDAPGNRAVRGTQAPALIKKSDKSSEIPPASP